MAMAQPSSTTSLALTRRFKAPREQVFQAWTDPQILKQWWGPEGYTTPVAEIDLRVGGSYRLGMKPPQGDIAYLVGRYQEINAPERLVYTWSWDGESACEEEHAPTGKTLVTVEFHDMGAITEVIVTHELLPDDGSRTEHEMGWSGSLDRLDKIFAKTY